MAIKYVCSDGAVFNTRGEADVHEGTVLADDPLYQMIEGADVFSGLEEEAHAWIKDNWAKIKAAMGEAGIPEQRHVSYPDPPNRNCHKNCTGYDPCSDICDDCKADDEDRQDK